MAKEKALLTLQFHIYTQEELEQILAACKNEYLDGEAFLWRAVEEYLINHGY